MVNFNLPANSRVGQGQTHKATILAMSEGGQPEAVEFFIISNTYDDGRLCEIFISTRREGSTINGLLDGVALNNATLATMNHARADRPEHANLGQGGRHADDEAVQCAPGDQRLDRVAADVDDGDRGGRRVAHVRA